MYFEILIAILFCETIVLSDGESKEPGTGGAPPGGSTPEERVPPEGPRAGGEGEEETTESLCNNPVIYSADRLLNSTVRVYRGNYYWELIGLPDREASVNGPFKIWQTNLGPVLKNTSIHTALTGSVKGITYKFLNQRWWSWWESGQQRTGGIGGDYWNAIPSGGFTAGYQDGNASGIGVPLMVGFSGIKVYYFNSQHLIWTPVGSKEGYIGGQYGEKFPTDITSAFSYPSDPRDLKIKYFVYLFKREKYCFRPWKLTSGKDCDEWRDNRELFGCNKKKSEKPPTGELTVGGSTAGGPSGEESTKGESTPGESKLVSANSSFKSRNSLALFLASIYIILVLNF